MRNAFVWSFTALGAAMLTCYVLGWTRTAGVLLGLLLLWTLAGQVYVGMLDGRDARRRARGDGPSPTRGQVPEAPPPGVRAQRRLDDPPLDG